MRVSFCFRQGKYHDNESVLYDVKVGDLALGFELYPVSMLMFLGGGTSMKNSGNQETLPTSSITSLSRKPSINRWTWHMGGHHDNFHLITTTR